jgi:hypothetical protein
MNGERWTRAQLYCNRPQTVRDIHGLFYYA